MKRLCRAAGRFGLAALAALVIFSSASRTAGAAQTLDIYFIDVEGGQSTLIITPAGQTLLVDTGYAGNDGRDVRRIMAAARDAGVTRIDYLLITHFHTDHDGGVAELAAQLPIGTFVDHGSLRDPGTADPTSQLRGFETYVSIRKNGQHLEPKPGDHIPIKSMDVVVVSADRAVITTPLSGAGQANAACTDKAPDADEPHENPRSTGIVLRYGRFAFVDLGDLTGAPLFSLFCPRNLIGQADVYLVPHHGGKDVANPAYIAAVQPRVAMMNNGATKGGAAETFAMLHQAPKAGGSGRLEDVWQIDRSRNAGVQNFADERIANLDEATGHWIKVSANQDGSFQVTNQRTGASKAYLSGPNPLKEY